MDARTLETAGTVIGGLAAGVVMTAGLVRWIIDGALARFEVRLDGTGNPGGTGANVSAAAPGAPEAD